MHYEHMRLHSDPARGQPPQVSVSFELPWRGLREPTSVEVRYCAEACRRVENLATVPQLMPEDDLAVGHNWYTLKTRPSDPLRQIL